MTAPDKASETATREAFVPARVIAVERAAQDLRRGMPVSILDEDGTRVIVVATELVTSEKMAALKGWSEQTPDIALTHNRAQTLKIRLYTEDAVLVPLPARLSAEMVRGLADPASDMANPLRGPFEAKREPVSRANIAAVKLAKIARLLPSVVTVTVKDAGTKEAFLHDLGEIANVSDRDIFDYDVSTAALLKEITSARVPLAGAENARIVAFRPNDGGTEHLAIVIGDPLRSAPVLARLHSECFTGDLLGSLKCDCGEQLRGAIDQIGKEGAGVLLYLAQEGRGIGLINKLRAYALQDQGFDTVEANERLGFEADERLFQPAAEMLRKLGFSSVRLMTNNPDKVEALERYGIEVAERVAHAFPSNEHNAFYLRTKADKSGHML